MTWWVGASKCRSGPELTNYRAVQNRQFRACQGKDHYMNRTMLGHWCRMGTVSADRGYYWSTLRSQDRSIMDQCMVRTSVGSCLP